MLLFEKLNSFNSKQKQSGKTGRVYMTWSSLNGVVMMSRVVSIYLFSVDHIIL